jgi:hypothetical protein
MTRLCHEAAESSLFFYSFSSARRLTKVQKFSRRRRIGLRVMELMQGRQETMVKRGHPPEAKACSYSAYFRVLLVGGSQRDRGLWP